MRMDEHIKRLIEKHTLEASKLSGNEALERYSMAYAQAKELGNAFTIRACAANLGAMHISLGRKEEAERGLKYLLEAVPPEGVSDSVSNGDLYFNLGLGYEISGQFTEAQSYIERAWEEYRGERDNVPMEIDSLKKIVQISRVRQKCAETVKWCQKLEETYDQAHRPVDQMLIMQQRITLQHKLGDEGLADAVQQCQERMAAIKEQGLEQGITGVSLLVHMSVMLTQFSEQETAREYLEEANSLLGVEHSESVEKAVVLQNLGTICNYLDDWETSLPYHQQAAAIYQRYAAMPPDPKTPIQPKAALRCQGHCVANHAYALVKMEDVDEARMLFNKALELAIQSDDLDTKWQMEEALGAVHFRMACHDLDLPSPRNANLRVQLPPSRIRHLEKSLEWYSMAVEHQANAPQGSRAVRDRLLDKCTLVKNFKSSATVAREGQFAQLYSLPPQPAATKAAADAVTTETQAAKASGEAEEGSSSDDEESDDSEEEDEVDEEVEGDSNEVDGSGDSSGDDESESGGADMIYRTRVVPKMPSLQRFSIPLGSTMRTPAEEDEDREQVNALYEAQLGDGGTLQRQENGRQQTIKVDVHAHHHSSSAESGSSESESEETDEEDSTDEEDAGRPVPPVPSQSPPATFMASGTYENPKPVEERQIGEQYRPPRSGPNYASLDFDSMNQRRSGASKSQDQDPDYEPVDIRVASPQGRHSRRPDEEDEQVDFEMGGKNIAEDQSKKDQKDSKTCIVM